MSKVSHHKNILVSTNKNGALYYVHTDHLNTPRKITDSTDTVVFDWRNADPFGANNPTTNTIGFNLRFPGQYFDNETNFYYNLNRYYNPSTGRYLQADPIGLEGGQNVYNYVDNNPLNGIDPLGLYLGESLEFLANDKLINFVAGYGDSASFGLSKLAREMNRWGHVNTCSAFYDAGEIAEVAVNFISFGVSSYLKSLIKGLSGTDRTSLRNDGTKLPTYKNLVRPGYEVHHINPLFGHKSMRGQPKIETIFPLGGLKGSVHSGSWNLKSLAAGKNAAHEKAHRTLIRNERLYRFYHNPGTSVLKIQSWG